MTDLTYQTVGGLTVTRREIPADYHNDTDRLAEQLDAHRGALFSSNYEYPGRYTRWEFGFAEPPVMIESRGRDMAISALNPRGGVLLALLRPVVEALPEIDQGLPDRALRDEIMTLKGIGPKTASWVVRNWRDSDQVAILDIHIVRACEHIGLFEPGWTVERHYLAMEEAFLAFAEVIGARPSLLDSVMWNVMRELARQPVIDRRMEPTADLPLFATVN